MFYTKDKKDTLRYWAISIENRDEHIFLVKRVGLEIRDYE